MLSGTSPFKDASEWLIFQRIIARDIRFPNYFSEAARDLIDKLLARNKLTNLILFVLYFVPTSPTPYSTNSDRNCVLLLSMCAGG